MNISNKKPKKKQKPGARTAEIIGHAPRLLPGDKAGAEAHRQKIVQALKKGGWSYPVWSKLYRLERSWWMRAQGLDKRFEIYGTLPKLMDIDDPIYRGRNVEMAEVLWEVRWILYEANLAEDESEGLVTGWRARKGA